MAPRPLPLNPGAMVEPVLMLPALPSMVPSASRESIGLFSSVGVSGSESMGAGSSWRREMAVRVEFLRSRQPRGLSASESSSMAIAELFLFLSFPLLLCI